MMRKLFYLFLLMLTANFAKSQKIDMDSLAKVALTNSAGIKPVPKYNRDSLFKALTLSKKSSERIALTYEIIGYDDHSTDKQAYLNKIYQWAVQNHDDVLNAVISSELAFNAGRNGDSDEGLKKGIAALKLARKTGDDQAISIAADNLGITYQASSTKAAKDLYLLGLKHSLSAKYDIYSYFNLANLAKVYEVEHRVDSAKFFFQKSFKFAVTHNLPEGIVSALVDLSAQSKEEQAALKYGRIAVNIARIYGNGENIGKASATFSEVFLKYKHLDSALKYGKIAYRAAGDLSYLRRSVAAGRLKQIFEKLQLPDSTLKYTELYYNFRLKLTDVEKIQRANLLAFAEQRRQQQAAATAFENKSKQQKIILIAILIGLVVLGVFSFFLIINNRQKNAANKLLQQQQEELKAAQSQLIQSEKMASLGELTAGIAHEIQNPLNFVNNFSEVSVELLDELEDELNKGDTAEAIAITGDVKQNLQKILHHGKRADGIVKGMLQHSRVGGSTKEPTDINKLADEYLRLAYHGIRSKDKNFNAELITDFDGSLPPVNVVPQDIGRVLLNLFTNAFYAVQQKQKTAGPDYKPVIAVTISSPPSGGKGAVVTVRDNGTGIPGSIKDKILQPFFTTKPTGEGTGLGLSLSYDIIVKAHGGKIEIDSREGDYSQFTIRIPATC